MSERVERKDSLPTQQFVEIKAVQQSTLLLKNGGLRQVVMVSGMNFDLKSEEEQEAIVFAYQNFLNSLNFPIQIFIHSRKLNIEAYLNHLSQLELKETSPLLRTQIAEYREFIRSFVGQNSIMHKSFFVIVPFDPVQLPETGQQVTRRFFGLFSKTPPKITGDNDVHLDRYISQLTQRSDQVVSGLNQIGLRAVVLNDDEITELFYNLYNPEAVEKKGVEIAHTSSEHTL